MTRGRFAAYLFPESAERAPAFAREIEQLSAVGLRTTAGVQVAVSLFMLMARLILTPGSAAMSLRIQQAAVIIGLGGLNWFLSYWRAAMPWARVIGLVSAFVTAAVLIWASMLLSSRSTNPNDFIPGQITLVLLVAVTAFPLWPLHTLSLGAAIGIDYYVSAFVAEHDLMEGLGPDENYMLFILMLTLLCAALTAVLYDQRRSNFVILQQTVEAGEALRDVQTRIVMTESASSLSRLAAAVSHEMNTPIGSLLSGVATLQLLADRLISAEPKDRPRLLNLQEEVQKSVQDSAQRLRDLVARMQRFTNLDQAEVQSSDLNDLLRDVAALTQNDGRPSVVELDLQPLPALVCRPQQLSVAFSSILNNAVNAVNGNGSVRICTKVFGTEIQVDIEDNGRGVESGELQSIFDPGFRVSGGRMAAGNWSLFSSRQIVREHGGDIRIASTAGKGTRITVTLPVEHRGHS